MKWIKISSTMLFALVLILVALGTVAAAPGLIYNDSLPSERGRSWSGSTSYGHGETVRDSIRPAADNLLSPPLAPLSGPALSVDTTTVRRPIDPNIYGVNFADESLANALNLPLNRWGGNATSRYSWLLDSSNRASDWFFENIPNDNIDPALLPNGSSSDLFIEANRRAGSETIMTIGMLGSVPRDREYRCGYSIQKYGAQQYNDSWRPDCGNGIRTDGTPITNNDPADTSQQVDESFFQDWMRHLGAKYGEDAVRFYSLDNEPMLWHHTHRDVHPEPVGYDEARDLAIQYGQAIRAVDADAQILGPAVWGWTAYFYSAIDSASGNWNNPPDRNAHGGTPFLPWYLQQMRQYEQQTGSRILDYLDIHYYTQAQGVALSPAGGADTQALRLRSTRSLWDPTYTDESWIGEPVMLIPRMQEWIDQNYPGTKLAITEYNFGALDHINGALAQADALGIFGREGVDLATVWDPPAETDPGAYAFRIYRNYDGQDGSFGDGSLSASSSDQERLAVYAAHRSSDGAITIMVVNKSGTPLTSDLALQGLDTGTAAVYQYSPANLQAIEALPAATISNGGLSHTFPADSLTLLVVQKGVTGDGVGGSSDPILPFTLYLPSIQE